ncbi:DUF2238 domain-containing protein [Candidatus Kaiserbacteria bacterium]|nr:DUF2238 domain-containing protein [Candidatus Kaiserbacteria bacterium]
MTNYQKLLAVVFLAAWFITSINPVYREAWFLENILVFIFVPVLIVAAQYFKLSDVSYTFITLFMVIHLVGAHYTYGEVPFGFTLQEWLDASRNMYDRFAHFSFGFLMVYPIREMFVHATGARGFWAYYFPLDIILSFSAIYEILEWAAVNIIDASNGVLFLATQGDVFDSAKDMGSALLGATIAMAIVLALNWALNREEFRGEMKESLRIKGQRRTGRIPIRELVR